MLTIMPDVFLAIYVNAVAGLTNSVLSIGFLFSMILTLWYGFIFTNYLGYYFNHKRSKMLEFLKFYVFSRNTLSTNDEKLGLKILAVSLDNLKILVIVTMIGLFYNAPQTQMVIVWLMYFMNAIFLFAVRPYPNLMQSIIFGLSDVCFGILVVLLYANHREFYETVLDTKEGPYDSGMIAMVIFIVILNLIVYIIPILKGNDVKVVIHHKAIEADHYDDDGLNIQKKGSTQANKIDEKTEQPITEKSSELRNHMHKEPVDKHKYPERNINTAEGTKRSQ